MHSPLVKLSFKFLALGVLTGCLLFYSGYGLPQAAPPRIVVADQPDSPLLITAPYVNSSDPLRPRYDYTVTNAGEKPIRAFTIQQSVSLGEGPPIMGTTLSHSAAVKSFLLPHDSRREEGGLGSLYPSPPTKVELSVDFVEFADGTRWGADASESGDRLDGIRAGGKAAVKKFREALAREGVEGLERALADADSIQPEGPPRGDMWGVGFRTGVNTVKSRLVTAKQKKGQDEVNRELAKPFDSTEGRQEP